MKKIKISFKEFLSKFNTKIVIFIHPISGLSGVKNIREMERQKIKSDESNIGNVIEKKNEK